MGRLSRAVFALMAVVAVGGSASCRSGSTSAETPLNGSAGIETPELAMERLKIQSYGLDGLNWELATPTAEGATSSNKMRADNIKITFYQRGKKATDLTADHGQIRFDVNPSSSGQPMSSNESSAVGLGPGDFYLSGNVVAVSTDNSRLTTDWLRYDKGTGLITSTAPVRVVRDDSVTTGVGLEATASLSTVKIFKQSVTIKEKAKKK